MEKTIVISDWTSLSGVAGEDLVQSPSEWKEVGSHASGIFWIETRAENTGAPRMHIETSAVPEERFFSDVVAPVGVTQPSSTFRVARFATDTTPLLRYVRWRAAGSAVSDWTVTFRIFAVLKQP
jgi:hypothetical protein